MSLYLYFNNLNIRLWFLSLYNTDSSLEKENKISKLGIRPFVPVRSFTKGNVCRIVYKKPNEYVYFLLFFLLGWHNSCGEGNLLLTVHVL